jgi:hypothetical protein
MCSNTYVSCVNIHILSITRNLLACDSTHNQWFKIIISELAKRQQKVEEWRKERQEQEMAECTFKPELISTYRVKKALALSTS